MNVCVVDPETVILNRLFMIWGLEASTPLTHSGLDGLDGPDPLLLGNVGWVSVFPTAMVYCSVSLIP